MTKKLFWLAAVVIFSDCFVYFQIIVHCTQIYPLGEVTESHCVLSADATDDYYNVRDLIFTFLETAETDFKKISREEKKISCQLAKGNLSDLIVKGKKDLAACLTDDFSYFGDFVNDTLQNFLDFFCDHDNENVEGYFTEDAKRCRADIKKPFFDNCLVKLFAKKNGHTSYDLSFNAFYLPGKRDEFCRKLLEVGPCTTELLESHCPQVDYYQHLSAKLFAQTIKPCDEYISYISSAKIAGTTLTVLSILTILVTRFCPVRKWYTDFRHRASSKTLTNSVI